MRKPGKGQPIQALVVDDSASAREELVQILQADKDISVVGHATRAKATQSTLQLRPGVIVFDVHKTDRASCQAIEQIMARVPTPILVLSNNTDGRQSPAVVEALVAGALDALPKPDTWTAGLEAQLRRTVRIVSGVHVIRHARGMHGRLTDPKSARTTSRQRVVAIGASTGGPSAIATVLSGLGGLTAPVLVVQHLHVDFTSGLVDWMSRVSALPVELAVHGQRARAGRVYFPPGGQHLRLGPTSLMELSATPATLHRPSVDELFRSVAEQAGAAAIGVLMTGMGDDGATGLLAIHERGGRTLAQDEASCAVFGMPRAAVRLGAVSQLLPPEELARAIVLASREALL